MAAARQIGSGGLFLIAGGMLIYAGLGMWLLASAAWPADCTPPVDAGRLAKLAGIYRCSPGLLSSGGAAEVGTFLWLWLVPSGLAALFLTLGLRRRAPGTRISTE